MIQNETAARLVSQTMLQVAKELNESLLAVQPLCPSPDFKAYRSAVGRILGEMLLGVMNPLYAAHPELTPPELR